MEIHPHHHALVRPLENPARELQALFAKCLDGRRCCSCTPKRAEELTNAFMNPSVRVEPNLPLTIVNIANRQAHLQLSAPRLVEDAPTQSCTQYVELGFRHGPFQT